MWDIFKGDISKSINKCLRSTWRCLCIQGKEEEDGKDGKGWVDQGAFLDLGG